MIRIINLLLNSTIIRFCVVGVINTLIGAGIMFLLYNCAGCSYWVSTIANYILGGIVSYFLNKVYTFKDKKRSWLQFICFILNVAICYVVSFCIAKIVTLLILGSYSIILQDNIAMCIGVCLYIFSNYFVQRFFIFKK